MDNMSLATCRKVMAGLQLVINCMNPAPIVIVWFCGVVEIVILLI